MNKKEKIDFTIKTLDELYPTIPIPLDHKDPYTLLIAVLLSAQSTDVRVNKITPLLFEKADNPYDMVKMSVEEIRAIIRPVGLSPMKSKGIHGLSEILIEKYNGEVPKEIELLEELPAVGHKTASVVVSQAFGIPAFPVDTHIHRLMYRWMLFKLKKMQNVYFRKKYGIACTYKLYGTGESIHLPEDGILKKTLSPIQLVEKQSLMTIIKTKKPLNSGFFVFPKCNFSSN